MGTQYGEINLFDLLKETFRQNPDYVIVGEIRGKEAYVLFQGMASGHPSFSTFHAASVSTLIKRLETPPINLSPSLVETLDVVVVCSHIKDQKRNIRRCKEVDEIIEVSAGIGKTKFNKMFLWDPISDNLDVNKTSVIFDRITARTGTSAAELMKEMKRRAKLLDYMVKKDMSNFRVFNRVINDYYKDPAIVLKRFGL